jgi:hypothetical protein
MTLHTRRRDYYEYHESKEELMRETPIKGECRHKDPQGYCELSNNVADKCDDLKDGCEDYEVAE